MRKLVLASLTLLGAVGCSAPGTFDGTVKGQSITVKSALFDVMNDANGPTNTVLVALSQSTTLCEQAKANQKEKNGRTLAIALVRLDGDKSVPLTTGVYALDSANEAGAVGGALGAVSFDDASCNDTLPEDSGELQGGKITLTKVDLTGGVLEGSYDVTVGPQKDHVTGEFSASKCAGAGARTETPPLCK